MLLVLNQIFPSHRWNMEEAGAFLVATGKLLMELLTIMAGVGLIVGALSVSGLSGTLVNDLLYLAGDSTLLLLLMGAFTSFFLGIGMTVTAAYIFLAIVLAPALIQGGLDPMSVHLFILYWGMLSFITPPVALGAFAAASIAGASALSTGFKAMRLGSVIYFIPFFFVLEPALIMSGTLGETLFATAKVAVGIVLIAGTLQRYLLGVGFLDRAGPAGMAGRALALVGGGLIALPTTEVIGINVSDATLLISGGTMAIIGVLLSRSVSPDSDVRTPLVSGAQI
jgi:TRAP-type uncharacterized transport system fused permease subunit